jgi:purine-cytosine permease-like protein
MLLTANYINFLVAVTGYTSTGDTGRIRLMKFALLENAVNSVYMFIGVVLPVKFTISYEGFMAFIGVNFIIMFILNILHYKKHKDNLNRNIIFIWISFLIANIGYFVFLLEDIGTNLYKNNGTWFNENDALHVLLIIWAFLIFVLLSKKLRDKVDFSLDQYPGTI